MWIEILKYWAISAGFIAFMSIDKKIGFMGGLVLSIIFTPLFGLFICLISPYRIKKCEDCGNSYRANKTCESCAIEAEHHLA